MYSLGRRIAFAYGNAIILMFFSEYFFLNESPVFELLDTLKTAPVLAVPALLSFAGFYTLFTYPMLVALSRFNARSLSGLLLAGTLFGWATEGLTVPVIYEAMPVSFFFPSVGWHGLIDVLLGWYLVRLAMRKLGWALLAGVFILLGAAWGVWATWYWGPDSMAPLTPQEFAVFATVSGSFWLVGMVLADRLGRADFNASKWEIWGVGMVYLVLFVVIAMPFFPFSLFILPLIGVTFLALWRGRNQTGGATILAQLHPQRPPWRAYALVPLTPLSAALVYPLMFHANRQVPTQDIVLGLLSISALWFALALVAPFFRRTNTD